MLIGDQSSSFLNEGIVLGHKLVVLLYKVLGITQLLVTGFLRKKWKEKRQ